MRHGITECRECQYCLPTNHLNEQMVPGTGSCRLHGPVADKYSGFGYWPIVCLKPGNGCREGIRMEPSAAVENP